MTDTQKKDLTPELSQLNELIHVYLETESLSKSQQASLNDILKSSPVAREHYDQMLETHINLQWLIAPESLALPSGLESQLTRPPSLPFRSTIYRATAAMIATSAIAAVVMLGLSIFMVETGDQAHVKPPSFFARVIYSDQVIQGKSHDVQVEGHWISAGTLDLEQGKLGIILDSGVQMQLTGPTKMELQSAQRCFLDRGSVTTRVPDGTKGFMLHTHSSSFLDQGNEYAVKASSDKTEVQVFKGKVKALTESLAGNNLEKIIEEKQAYRIKDAAFQTVPAVDRQLDWQRFKLEKPKSISFSFDDITQIQSTPFGGQTYQGVLKNRLNQDALPTQVAGPFGAAVRLHGQGDYVETDFPGIKGNLPRSVSFWVKAPPTLTSNKGKSIVSWGEAKAGQRWQIGICVNPKYGKVGAIRTDFSHGYVTGSTDIRDGQWHFITSVFIGSNKSQKTIDIRHYVDGKLEGVTGNVYRNINTHTDFDGAKKLQIGYWDSWSRNRGNPLNTTFIGSVDEVTVFNRALYPSQILELMNYNKVVTSSTQ